MRRWTRKTPGGEGGRRTLPRARIAAAALVTPLLLAGPLSGQAFDVVVHGGRIVDGTGREAYTADIGIRGDRIARIGDLSGADARLRLDARGLWVFPGFIDTHTHAGGGLATAELSGALPLLAQGITTILANPDGGGPVDLRQQRRDLLEHGLGVNVGLFIGHGSVRGEVLGSANREATPAELDSMRSLVREAMEAGAFGLSSGTFYVPGRFAPPDELVELGRVVAEYGGAYQSHIRDESDYSVGVEAAVGEVVHVAREAGIPGVVTHIKVLGPPVWGRSADILRLLESARAEGVEVYADQYPYLASATGLSSALVPAWARAGGGDSLRARLDDPETGRRIRAEMEENLARRGGAERLQFRHHRPDPSIEGRTLAEVAAERGGDAVEVALDLLREGSAGVVSFNMTPEDVRTFMTWPWTMTASDGDLVPMGSGVPHPRNYGAFPRKIRVYVVEEEVLSLPEAVRSMTGLPAEVYGIEGRGVIREGAFADLVSIDLERYRDTATFTDPHHLAEGVVYALVNGWPAILGGRPTHRRWGTFLHHGRAAEP